MYYSSCGKRIYTVIIVKPLNHMSIEVNTIHGYNQITLCFCVHDQSLAVVASVHSNSS